MEPTKGRLRLKLTEAELIEVQKLSPEARNALIFNLELKEPLRLMVDGCEMELTELNLTAPKRFGVYGRDHGVEVRTEGRLMDSLRSYYIVVACPISTLQPENEYPGTFTLFAQCPDDKYNEPM